MKTKHKIILSISLILNVFFIALYSTRFYDIYKRYMVKDVAYTDGSKLFFQSLKEKHPELSDKKYYYVNVWNTLCVPCIKEMPFLDSIAEAIHKEDVAYIYVTDDSEQRVQGFLSKKAIPAKNFVFLNDMNEYISSICNLKHTQKVYPMHLVIDAAGNILFYSQGTFDYMTLKGPGTAAELKHQQEFNTPAFVRIIKGLP